MRHFLCLAVLSLLCVSALAQNGPERGRVKKFDAEKGTITVTTADGKDVEAVITPQTQTRGLDGQELPDFRTKGVAAGTGVMFLAREQGGKMVLVGLRLPPPGGQPGAPGKANGKVGGKMANIPAPPPPRDSIGVKPLTELGTEKYKGESGGLYGNGSNEPPPALQAAARQAAVRIQPLDAQGKPSASGKVVLVSIGMSNTTQEFSTFKQIANRDPDKSDKLTIVDLAQGGQIPVQWNDPQSEAGQRVWGTVAQRLKAAEVTNEQVQVAWLKQAVAGPAQYGEFPASAKKLQADLVTSLQVVKKQFPNLQLVYLSSRIYGGYATTPLNPEPYAFEGAFAMRGLIEAQLAGDAQLNTDAARGEVKSPVLLWGPYLWGDGVTPRKDGLVWNRDDLVERDGTHPSDSGRKKVADLLLAFFHADAYAKGWYLGK